MKLPIELRLAIYGQIDPEDLASLRQTNRQIFTEAEESYLRNCVFRLDWKNVFEFAHRFPFTDLKNPTELIQASNDLESGSHRSGMPENCVSQVYPVDLVKAKHIRRLLVVRTSEADSEDIYYTSSMLHYISHMLRIMFPQLIEFSIDQSLVYRIRAQGRLKLTSFKFVGSHEIPKDRESYLAMVARYFQITAWLHVQSLCEIDTGYEDIWRDEQGLYRQRILQALRSKIARQELWETLAKNLELIANVPKRLIEWLQVDRLLSPDQVVQTIVYNCLDGRQGPSPALIRDEDGIWRIRGNASPNDLPSFPISKPSKRVALNEEG